jgi:tetratricopeptide (TPR) repeat protein
MLFFAGDSCEPCDMMEKWTFTDNRVSKALEGFIPVKINGQLEVEMVQRFNVKTFPMIIFVILEEGEIDRKAGYRNADFFLQWIGEVKANRTTFKALDKKLRHDPDNLELLLKQAHNFIDADEMERARELAEKAASVAPGDADVFALLGLCHLRHGKTHEAEAAVAAALQADPQNEEARRLRISILLKKADAALADGNITSVRSLLFSVLEHDIDNFDARMRLGRAYKAADETDMAFAEFRQAALLRPNSPTPHAALAELHQENGDEAAAKKEYLKAIEIEPRYELPYFRLMELYEKHGDRNGLMGIFEKVLPIEPAGAHNEIAWLMATSKHPEIFDPEAAVRHVNRAIELEPHSWYIDTLAESYFAQGEYDLAIAIIKEAIAKEPTNMTYYQEQLEKFQDAKRHETVKENRGGKE